MFDRPHHRRIAAALQALDANVLLEHRCAFGGGTAIALLRGEYRESVDVDFLVSDLDGYKRLRTLLTTSAGLAPLCRPGASLVQRREVRADQYGLRTVVAVDGVDIKFEIILEGRIQLAPGRERIVDVPRLGDVDLVASKLLANSDRYADPSVCSRDLIDLAMLAPRRDVWTAATEKARAAYGHAVDRDLLAAIEFVRARPGHLARCMTALGMTTPLTSGRPLSVAQLWARIRKLCPAPIAPP